MALWAAPPNRTTRAGAVNLHVPVWTGAGEVLEASQVEAKVDGSPATVLHLAGPSDSLMLLVVLDLAGDLTLVDPARQALAERIRKLPANVYVGLLRAQDGLRVLVDPGSDRQKVTETILGLTISGRAALLNTIETVTRLGDSILKKAHVRLAVLYVTDSHVGNYREDFTNPVVNSSDSRDLSRRFPEGLIKERISQLEKSLSRTQAPVFVVHLNYRSDRLNEAYQTGLLSLATATGGSADFCRSLVDIPEALTRTLDSITAHHSVEIQLPGTRTGPAAVELLANGRSLRYRNRFQLVDR